MNKERIITIVVIIVIIGVTLYLVYKKLGLVESVADIKDEKAKKSVETDSQLWSRSYWKTFPTSTMFTNAFAQGLATQIYDSRGFFDDDEEAVYSVFRQMKHRANVSQVADAFYALYKDDLYNYMANFLSQKELDYIYGIILTKPS